MQWDDGKFILKQLDYSPSFATSELRLVDYLLVENSGSYFNCSLVYTTQVNTAFRARWLASSEEISQVRFTSEQPKKNKMAFVAIFSQIKLLFGPLLIQLVWYILKQIFTSVSVKVMDIYLHFGE